jgi:hypothetical protein
LVVSATAGGAPRLWLVATGAAAPIPLTPEGRAGRCEIDAAGGRVALIDAAGRLAVIDLAHLAAPAALRDVPVDLAGHRVCGWSSDGQVLARTTAAPVRVVAVDPATGAVTPRGQIAPPAAGLKGVDTFLVRGDVYAYSYGQELSQLYLMTAEPITRPRSATSARPAPASPSR